MGLFAGLMASLAGQGQGRNDAYRDALAHDAQVQKMLDAQAKWEAQQSEKAAYDKGRLDNQQALIPSLIALRGSQADVAKATVPLRGAQTDVAKATVPLRNAQTNVAKATVPLRNAQTTNVLDIPQRTRELEHDREQAAIARSTIATNGAMARAMAAIADRVAARRDRDAYRDRVRSAMDDLSPQGQQFYAMLFSTNNPATPQQALAALAQSKLDPTDKRAIETIVLSRQGTAGMVTQRQQATDAGRTAAGDAKTQQHVREGRYKAMMGAPAAKALSPGLRSFLYEAVVIEGLDPATIGTHLPPSMPADEQQVLKIVLGAPAGK